MRSIVLFVFFASIFGISCTHQGNKEKISLSDSLMIAKPEYAKRFSYAKTPNGYTLSVFNPWQGASEVEYTYALDSTTTEHNLENNPIIPFPVNRVVCLSTTHIAYIDLLNQTDAIVGVSGVNLATNTNVQTRYKKGLLHDVGYEQAMNYEVLVSIRPDVVFAYGVGAEMTGYIQKFTDLGIPVVFVADYLEDTPLGKTEWIKFFSLFFDCVTIADSLFQGIESNYNEVKSRVADSQIRPTVFLNLPWKDIWYVPGNDGYMVKLINDAGGQYALSHLEGANTVPLNLEAAMEYGLKANYWLNTGTANTLDEIASNFPMSKQFPALINGRVYNNNRLTNAKGGNDFWESGVVNPHVILSDLVKIFHPNSIEHEFTYYQKLN
ncbi:MAG: ABC transporter substrate-binding protein [Bacteroidales bacterium]|nr:ABC transporter substrate-binding protein [Bacteroidales bacterium]